MSAFLSSPAGTFHDMQVTVSRTFPAAIRGEIAAVVRAGFEGVDCDDVEVHVKARTRTRRTYLAEWVTPSGRVRRQWFHRARDAIAAADAVGGEAYHQTSTHPKAYSWGGRTYDGVPSIARVEPSTGYLVTINAPADPRRLTRYPMEARDPRLKTGPVVRLAAWQDELFHIAAHEARHVHQFRHGLSRSELDAERWAALALDAWRGPQLRFRDL